MVYPQRNNLLSVICFSKICSRHVELLKVIRYQRGLLLLFRAMGKVYILVLQNKIC